MFMNMATVEPQPGKEKDLADQMRAFRDALRAMPGLVNVYVLREEATRVLAGLSIWKDRASFEFGMADVNAPRSHASEGLRKAPRVVRQLTEI
jgi:heme-degrading monooxygenase HmoA